MLITPQTNLDILAITSPRITIHPTLIKRLLLKNTWSVQTDKLHKKLVPAQASRSQTREYLHDCMQITNHKKNIFNLLDFLRNSFLQQKNSLAVYAKWPSRKNFRYITLQNDSIFRRFFFSLFKSSCTVRLEFRSSANAATESRHSAQCDSPLFGQQSRYGRGCAL